MLPFQTLVLLLSVIDFGTTLPVTSKPIENTPEHLAWEAWIMIPPTQNKTRKITPKSIFILPNKTTIPPAINCPPGYLVENSKCIQTVQIDPGTILLNHLISTFNQTYDEDYEYDYDEPNQVAAESSNQLPDYNDGPLKIDLLRPGTIRDYGMSAENDELNPKPFRGEDASSSTTTTTTTDASTTTTTTTESSQQSNRFPEFDIESSTARSSTEDSMVTVTSTAVAATKSTINTRTTTGEAASTTTTDEATSSESSSTSTTESTSAAPSTTTTTDRGATTLLVEDISSAVQPSSESTPDHTTLPPSSSSTLTSSTAVSSDAFIFPDEELISNEDYSLLEEEQTRPTNTGDDYTVEEVTSPDYTSTGTEEGIDEEEEILPVHATHQTSTEVKIDNDDQTVSTDKNSTASEEEKSTEPTSSSSFSESSHPVSSTKSESTLFLPFSTKPTFFQTNSEYAKPTFNTFINHNFPTHQTIQNNHDDLDPILDNVENGNRFVYHHLGTAPGSSKPQRSDSHSFSPSHDVQEQIQMINKIVEENKKRANGGSNIRFPADTFIQTDNLRADFVRFPESTQSHHQITSTMPTRLFTADSKIIPILRQPPRFTPTSSFNLAPHQASATSVTHPSRQDSKPFWWLPSGWEVDRNGDKPLLLRFWSRASPASSSDTQSSPSSSSVTSPTAMTTASRENSRRPTDNLYREISAHEFYKVLGAQNHHRHHNTNDFT